MGWLIGYRTYLSALMIISHQVLKVAGVDIPQENLSTALDVVLSILVMIFRQKANNS